MASCLLILILAMNGRCIKFILISLIADLLCIDKNVGSRLLNQQYIKPIPKVTLAFCLIASIVIYQSNPVVQ